MACLFYNPGSEAFLHKGVLGTTSDAVVSAAPLTMFCWGNLSSFGSIGTSLMSISREPSGFGGYSFFSLFISSSGVVRAFLKRFSPSTTSSATAGTATLNTWQSYAAVFASSTSRKAYLNGVPGTEDTASVTPDGLEQTYIGAQTTTYTTDHNQGVNGCLAYCAIWSAALTDAEIASLHAGTYTPDEVRPESLVLYVPLVNAATKAQAFAWTGAAVAAIADMLVQNPADITTCEDGPSFETPSTPDTSTDLPTTVEREQEYVVRQFIPFERPPFIEFDVTDEREEFPVPFPLMDQESLRVTVDHVEILQSEFTFTGIVDEYIPQKRGGALTLDTEVEDAIVRIWANPTPSRTTDLTSGQLNATRINSAFETLWRIHLAQRYHLKRTQTLGPEALAQINETMSGNLFVI